MHEVLINRLGGLSLPRKSVVRLTVRPDMNLDVYVDVKQQHNNNLCNLPVLIFHMFVKNNKLRGFTVSFNAVESVIWW